MFLLLLLSFSIPQTDSSNTISDEEAKQKLVMSVHRFYEVINGGKGELGCSSITLTIDKDIFYYYCGMSTINEVTEYLEEVFTPEYTESLIKSSKFQELDGKLIKIATSSSSAILWDKSEIISKNIINDNSMIITFRMPDFGYNYIEKDFEFNYVSNKGWRLNHGPNGKFREAN